MNPTDVAAGALHAVSSDISIWTMFWNAHVIVKVVMLGLLAASVWCWGIIINKELLFRSERRAMDQFENEYDATESLKDRHELFQDLNQLDDNAIKSVFKAGMSEFLRTLNKSGWTSANLTQRLDKVLDLTIQREMERLESNLLVLATIGSASPFIGLFGTVWGIMNSFRSIAASKNTSLAVVAPGIAEALFATAIGLFAAIPAVIAYNKLQAEAAKQQARVEGFADEFSAYLSRQIDERIAAE